MERSIQEHVLGAFHRAVRRPVARLRYSLQATRRPTEAVDPRIAYPCYKSFDEFMDVGRLEAMDGALREAVARHVYDNATEPFDVGPLKLGLRGRRYPGSTTIFLSERRSPFYFDIDKPDKWSVGKAADEFPELMDFIGTLPFQATARMMILYDPAGRRVTAHRDHAQTGVLHEFVWFRTNFDKAFYLQDWRSKKKSYVTSYSAWFDSVNQYHGADASDKPTISIRVDGYFTDDLRKRSPRPVLNLASTPALWACLQEDDRTCACLESRS